MPTAGAKRRQAPDDDCSDEEPDRLRSIVARETRRRVRLEAADLAAAAAVTRSTALTALVNQAVIEQGLTAEDLAEFVDLGSDFSWTAPLSRTRAIEFLNRALSQQPSSERAHDQQQQRQQH